MSLQTPRKVLRILLLTTLAFASLGPSSAITVVTAFSVPRNGRGRSSLRILKNGGIVGGGVRWSSSSTWAKKKDDSGDVPVDPNPGGLNQWNDDNDDDNRRWEDLSFPEQVREWFTSPEGREDIKTYTVSLGVALLLRLLIIEPRYIPSLSMYPTFEVGDQLAVEKVTKRIRPFSRKEVVVFNPPARFRDIVGGPTSQKAKEALIKRIVAIEGDKVEIMGGKLYVNGVVQDEPFTAEEAEYEFGPVIVPKGEVLCLGDNRNHSLDGHIWGFLPTENVIGRAVFVYWPPWRVGTTGMY
jgi:signal peptidase I